MSQLEMRKTLPSIPKILAEVAQHEIVMYLVIIAMLTEALYGEQKETKDMVMSGYLG